MIKPYAKQTANSRARLRESNTIKKLEPFEPLPKRKLLISTDSKSSTIALMKSSTPKSHAVIRVNSATKSTTSTNNRKPDISQTLTKPKTIQREKTTPRNDMIFIKSTYRPNELSSHRKQKSNVTIKHLKAQVKNNTAPDVPEKSAPVKPVEQEVLYSFDCRTQQQSNVSQADKSKDESSIFDCEQYGTFSSQNSRIKFILEKAQLINENITSCYTHVPESAVKLDAIARIKLRHQQAREQREQNNG